MDSGLSTAERRGLPVQGIRRTGAPAKEGHKLPTSFPNRFRFCHIWFHRALHMCMY